MAYLRPKSSTRLRRWQPVFNIETRSLLPIEEALMAAAKVGDIDTASACLMNGADVNCHKDDGVTPLFLAAEVGHRGMVHFLVTQTGIDPNIKGTFGRTPICTSAYYGFLGATKMLLRHNANPNIGDEFGKTPLHNSIRACNLPMTTLLVRHGADVNQPDSFGNLPLYLAMIEVNNPDQSRFLLRNGALPNMRSPRGDAVLFDCVVNLDSEIQNEVVHMLIRYGGRVNIGNPFSYRTPLHSCAFHNNIGLTKFLLKMGANPKAVTHNGITPLDVAAEESNWEIFEILSDAIYEIDGFREDSIFLTKPSSSIECGRLSSILKPANSTGSKMKNESRVKFSKALEARTKVTRSSSKTKGSRKPSKTGFVASKGTSEKASSSMDKKQDLAKPISTMRSNIPKSHQIKKY